MVTVPDGDDDARQALLSGSSSNPTMMPRGGVPDNNVALLQPHPQTGLVHCLLERRRSGGSSNSGGGGRSSSSFLSLPTTGGNRNGNRVVTLRLEEGAASPETSAGNKAGAVLLQARAVAAHRFAISLPTIRGDNDSKNNNDNNNNSHPTLAPPPPVWATLARLQSSLSGVTYGLRVHGDGDNGDGDNNGDGGVLRAAIVYKVPSVASFLSQKDAPPRRCQMAVLWHDNDNDKDGRSNKSNTNNSNSSSNPHWFEAACRDAIQQSSGGDLSSLANVAGVTLYASREPHRKPNGNMGLNFRGRGRQASPKNMQLTVTTTVTTGSGNDGNNNSGTTNSNNGQQPAVAVVHAQMAKWDTDRYHLDFAMPPKPPGNNHGADSGGGTSMSLLTAFAFGLAQLDL